MTLIQTPPAPNGRSLGWRPQLPDARDFPLSKRLSIRHTSSLPEKFSFREKMTPVRDQGNCNGCVGFSISAAISYLRRVDADHYNTEHSPLFAYYQARLLEDEVNLTWTKIDQGAVIRLGVKAVNKTGNPPESSWPFRIDRVTKKPTATSYKAANRWRLGAYYSCANVTEVMNALSEGIPVVGGFSCYSSMFTEEVDKSGNIPMPSGQILGGHAVCFCGYDKSAGHVTFKNSWSEDWGDKGYGTLPIQYLSDPNLADDFWAIAHEDQATAYPKMENVT